MLDDLTELLAYQAGALGFDERNQEEDDMAVPTNTLIVGDESRAELTPAEHPTAIFERLARDPGASVDKIERLMALWERVEAKKAESAFNAAMSEAQQEMQPVRADAVNPQTKSKYASCEALDRALRPVYTKHRFGLSFDTGECPIAEWVRVLCYVTHGDGHARTYHADIPADGKGAKGGDVMTKTHAVGSAMSYGQRYLMKFIFNIAIEDDDGNAAGVKPTPEPPKGYAEWKIDMRATADNGWTVLRAAYTKSKQDFQDYADKYDGAWKETIKGVAREADKNRARRTS